MIVHPDKDGQLNDPAFAPNGTIPVDTARASYDACASQRDLLVLSQPLVAAKNAAAGAAITVKIQAIDIAATAALDILS